MAEAFVSFVIERLGNALVQEASVFKGVHGQFQLLQKELISINGFLRTADMKRSDDPGILMWVADIRDIAYDVDDIIDSFILQVASKRRRTGVHKKISDFYEIGREMESLFDRIEEIDKRRQRYGITIPSGRSDYASSSTSNEITIPSGRNDDASSSSSNKIRLRRSYPGAEEDNIIGLEEDTNRLMEELMKEGEERRVVSICGVGGLGKTTLAKRVYNHDNIKSHFDCHAWTFISQQCRVGDVLQEIIKQVTNVSGDVRGNRSEAQMMDKLSTILKEKRYLVVLDDVWNKEAWDMLKSAFPHGKNGSKVMLTTRNVDVAWYADRWGYKFEPRKLNEDVAWNLILKITSAKDDVSRNQHVSSDMEKCGRDIVKRCGGLPLAIMLVGGILATKKTLSQWETVSKDIDQAGDFTVLALSYNDLPFHMKPLFLYLGLYPEDYQIPIMEVIKMWIAEGMVVSKQGSQVTMEEEGKQYVEEMIQRSMIQVGSRKKSGGVKTCRLHDMLRDLSILKASEENFFQTIGNDMVPSDGSPSLSTATCNLRRCAIYLGKERYAFSKHIVPRIRTVIFFQGNTFNDSSSSDDSSRCVEIAYQDFKHVRVLDVQKDWADVSVLCRQVLGKLTNLRYLGLSGCRVKKLPKSIGNLIFLETLDVRGWDMHLPNVIWKMSRLRHLYMDWQTEICDWPLRLDTLKQLQTLTAWKGLWKGITDLEKLINLRKLDAIYLSTEDVTVIVNYVVDVLDNLQSLRLTAWDGFPDLEQLSQNRHLLKLRLDGEMTRLHLNWPSNLVKLNLISSKISEDPMPVFEKLQHLEHLVLGFQSFLVKEMVCSRDGFPRLEHLQLTGLQELEEWIVENGALPCLTALVLDRCEKLKKIPQGVKFLTKLQKLNVIQLFRDTFCERVKQGGEDWQTVQHIPCVTTEADRSGSFW